MKRFAVVALSVLIHAASVFGQNNELRFERITMADGLSQGTGNCLLKDHKGFMWIGTALGLNRFDGYAIKIFKSVKSDSSTLSYGHITCLFEDKDSTLWIGTLNGINRLNRKTETFTRIKTPSGAPELRRITCITQDAAGNRYFGTEGGILFLKNGSDKARVFRSEVIPQSEPKANQIRKFFHHEGTLLALTGVGFQKVDSSGTFTLLASPSAGKDFVLTHCIFKDSTKGYWFGTESGLGYSSTFSLTDIKFPFGQLKDVPVMDIEEDETGRLWIGTVGKGLAILDKERRNVNFHTKQISNEKSLQNNAIIDIYKDNTDIIWVGGFGGGISKYDPSINRFNTYRNQYSDNLIALIEASDGKIWFVNSATGLSYIDPVTQEISNIKSPGIWPYGIAEDRDKNIWAIQPGVGLAKVEPSTSTLKMEVPMPAGYTIISAQDGMLYASVQGKCLVTIDPATKAIHEIDSSKKIGYINFITQGKNNDLWICGAKGKLVRLDIATKTLTFLAFNYNGSIVTDRLISVFEGANGLLWLAYSGKGLYLADPKTQRILKVYNTRNGLPNDDVITILDDQRGKIWISTINGLVRFDPIKEKFSTYTTQDGLVDNEFNSFVAFRNKSGKLYFGGMEGFNTFYPDDIIDNTHIPPVVLTDFKINNRSVPIRHSPDSSTYFLNEVISETKHLELLHDQTVFSFEFASLNYSIPSKNQYAYKMVGFDQDWIYSGTKRSATYTNLAPGTYTFVVKASNNSGAWNESGTSILITIHPPFYATWWAYVIYVIAGFAILYAFWRYTARRTHLRNQLEIKSLESKKLQEIDQIKTRFYTNVSHEFRTPLTLILGPLESATSLAASSGNLQIARNLEMVNRNAQRLLELINQLMDFSKLESGNMKLQLQESDIVRFLRTCTLSFSSLAVSKGIALQFKTTAEYAITSFDKDKLEKILNNLLSNALKFTREGGSVEVMVDFSKVGVVLQVTDDGIGIPEDKIEYIFNRFYQLDSNARTFEGTGIGLALLKELVLLCNGEVEVKSKEGKGTIFVLTFPMAIKEMNAAPNRNPQTFVAGAVLEEGSSERSESPTEPGLHHGTIHHEEGNQERQIILIVEDNQEIRSYIKTAFGNEFLILEADNGEKGLAVAEKHVPDVVITDIMMPKMDGQELCRLLKSNEKTSHIPVIILTAKASQENKLEGLETGADDYITKPFYLKELQVRVNNLLEQRERLRKRFTQKVVLQPSEVAITSADEVFLNKCIAVIEANMSNSEFSVDAFGKEIGMSRSQLHRKLTALIDQSASEFIRNMRLKRAAELIKKNYGNTAEVAYEVGFNSVSYFIKCFKEMYGKTPSEARGDQ